jgi:hypothetical protein
LNIHGHGDIHSDSQTQRVNIWNCPLCGEELGELNAYCVYCKVKDGSTVYNQNKYYVRDVFVRHIGDMKMSETDSERIAAIQANERMTPQEKLFSELFYHEKMLVKDMDILTLRAHREELEKIAFEARARLTAADDEESDRKKKASPAGPKGFSRSVNVDDTTTNAINTIKERQKKLTGKEKIQAGLIALYMKGGATQTEAEKIAAGAMGAGNILARVKESKESKEILLEEQTRSPLSQENGFVIHKSAEELNSSKPQTSSTDKPKLFNPFEKKN